MSEAISISTDVEALKATGLVAEDSPARGLIDGRSGGHVCYNGNMSMVYLTSIDDLESLAALPMIEVFYNGYEDVFGTAEREPLEGAHVLYLQVYDYTAPDFDDGDKFFYRPGGADVSRIL